MPTAFSKTRRDRRVGFESVAKVDDIAFVPQHDPNSGAGYAAFWKSHPGADWAFVAQRVGEASKPDEAAEVGPYVDLVDAAQAGHDQFGVGRFAVKPVVRVRRPKS